MRGAVSARRGRAVRHILALSVLVVSLVLAGCSAPLAGARLALNAVSSTYNETEALAEKERVNQGNACLAIAAIPAAEECLVTVRTKWAKVRAASEALVIALAAASTMLAKAEALDAMGRPTDATKIATAVDLVLTSVDAMRAEFDALAVH